MPERKFVPVSLATFAKSLGVTRQSVEAAIHAGRITSCVKWGRGFTITDAEMAKAEYESNTRPRARAAGQESSAENGHPKPSPTTLAAATLRERNARADLIELDVQRKKRTLIPLREAELRYSALVVAARTKLLGIPSKFKQRAQHQTVADLAILDELLREGLDELANEEPAE